MDAALKDNPIHPKQHGFLKGKSTESALSNTVNYIEKFIFKNQYALGIFLDISSAFDSICPEHIRNCLLKHGGEKDMVEWYYGYLKHRDLFFDLHGQKTVCSTGVGFPQGGVCSAKFWLIAFDKAIQIINTLGIEGNGYADDCSAIFGGNRVDHLVIRLEKMLQNLTGWGRECGLRFNPDKTVAVLFTRKRKIPNRFICFEGKYLPYSDTVRYLGVDLDAKLHWKINNKIKIAKRVIMTIANVTQNSFGPSPKLMRWTYHGIVKPMLSYGALVWAHEINTDLLATSLRKLNRLAINTFCNIPRSTPTRFLEIALDVPPLELYFQQLAIQTYYRLKPLLPLDWSGEYKNKTYSTSHLKYWGNFYEQIGIASESLDTLSGALEGRKFVVNRKSFDRSYTTYPSELNIFTDGSKIENRVGAGYVFYNFKNIVAEGRFKLHETSTVFQAEITAIKQAAMKLTTLPEYKFVRFYVDSQAAFLALNGTYYHSRLVLETFDCLNKACEGRKIILNWIKAHDGTEGNEKADLLAKEGGEHGIACNPPFPKSELKNRVHELIYTRWEKDWMSYKDARMAKIFYQKPDSNLAKIVLKLSRYELSRFLRLVSGHNGLFYFKSVIDGAISATCRFCKNETETFYHLATECPSFIQSRTDIFLDVLPLSHTEWSVRGLLSFSYIPAINAAIEGDTRVELFSMVETDPLDDSISSALDDS